MPIPVINIAQMRAWEKATWASGQTEAEIIRRVGKRIARRARKLTRADDLIIILIGKGHNGEDARAAKPHLDGRKVKLVELLLPASDLIKVEMILREKPALVIDGIFGIGLNRPLNEAWQKIIAAVNAAKIPVLSVDVPSGLNAETGENFGAVIAASVTQTVGAPKAGLLAPAAWPSVGRLELADDVGFVPCSAKSELNWVLPEDFENFPPPRMVSGHKGSFGHAVIVAGSFGYHGAGVLTAHGAQRAQPGLVTLFTQSEVYVPVAAQLSAAMVNVWLPETSLPENATAFLIGPGLAALKDSEALKNFTRQLWREAKVPVIVDASALDFLAADSFPPDAVRVLTPHPGEAARLLATTAEKIQSNRVQSLRDISRKYGGCWVVLKGSQTLIGRAVGDIFVNSSGNPHLAQGGSGDLLAGFITGLLAQPALRHDAAKTIAFAVWEHGTAADNLQSARTNWTIEDLAEAIGNIA
ncbi:MAG: NAD(P)H-hydrate dehydratase [Verrucomicrobiota bacterium]|jgi:NAD(P)H-hydrate epimerase